jgi:monofunctional glycosyltransferase
LKKFLKSFLRLFSFLISASIVVGIVIAIIFGTKGYQMYRDAITQTPMDEMVESIRDRDDFIEFDQLPNIYVDAVIAVEDQRFWTHHGIDCLAVGRAVWNDIKTLSFAEGGSTITQQLMKNQYFTQEKRLERKFAELFAAWELENQYSKEDIFELYINTIYFGSGYYGIYDAAQGYYGKNPWELTEAESVMLAGLPNAPSSYSPDSNPELAKQRMKQVLNRMIACKVISEEEANRIYTEI